MCSEQLAQLWRVLLAREVEPVRLGHRGPKDRERGVTSRIVLGKFRRGGHRCEASYDAPSGIELYDLQNFHEGTLALAVSRSGRGSADSGGNVTFVDLPGVEVLTPWPIATRSVR